MSNKLLVAGVAIAAAASSAHAAETHPFVEPVVTGDVAFLATFSDGLGSWSGSKNEKYNGACARSDRESEANGGIATTSTFRKADRVSVPSRPRVTEANAHPASREIRRETFHHFGRTSPSASCFLTIRFFRSLTKLSHCRRDD